MLKILLPSVFGEKNERFIRLNIIATVCNTIGRKELPGSEYEGQSTLPTLSGPANFFGKKFEHVFTIIIVVTIIILVIIGILVPRQHMSQFIALQ